MLSTKTDLTKENLRILKTLGKGKSGESHLAQHHGELVILKQMHQEPNDYYHFERPKVELEMESYKILSCTGIRIPKLLHADYEEEYLIKEYIPGKTVAELLALGPLDQHIIDEIVSWTDDLQIQEINLDFFPTNFVVHQESGKLYYVDYEHNPYSEEWNFANWGIYYWLNPIGFRRFLETGNPDFINQPGTPKPIRTSSMEAQRHQLIGAL